MPANRGLTAAHAGFASAWLDHNHGGNRIANRLTIPIRSFLLTNSNSWHILVFVDYWVFSL
jgi:hypothetical protein